MRVHSIGERFLATVAATTLASASGVQGGAAIYYDASVTPDHPSLQSVFHTRVQDGTSWSVSNGELRMTTAYGRGIWFGNHAGLDPLPWQIADNALGNMVSARARLALNSKEWNIILTDGTHAAMTHLMDGFSRFYIGSINGNDTLNYSLDTTTYHTYSLLLHDGQVSYYVDDQVIYSGSAYLLQSPKYLLVGDNTVTSLTGVGTMYLSSLDVLAGIPEPATLCMIVMGLFEVLPRSKHIRTGSMQ